MLFYEREKKKKFFLSLERKSDDCLHFEFDSILLSYFQTMVRNRRCKNSGEKTKIKKNDLGKILISSMKYLVITRTFSFGKQSSINRVTLKIFQNGNPLKNQLENFTRYAKCTNYRICGLSARWPSLLAKRVFSTSALFQVYAIFSLSLLSLSLSTSASLKLIFVNVIPKLASARAY